MRQPRTILLAVLATAILLLGGCIKPDPEKQAPTVTETLDGNPTEAPDPWAGIDTETKESDTDEIPNLPEDDRTKRY